MANYDKTLSGGYTYYGHSNSYRPRGLDVWQPREVDENIEKRLLDEIRELRERNGELARMVDYVERGKHYP